MYKKIFISFFLVILILVGLYTWKTKKIEPLMNSDSSVSALADSFEDKTFSYKNNKLSSKCKLGSEMACAVDFAVKCTLNPDHDGCRESKLPKFIFMTDEALERPTEMTFKIAKIKPINADLVEVHTDSTCNGKWFGLCQGRIIYVLIPSENGSWRVKDIYAIEI